MKRLLPLILAALVTAAANCFVYESKDFYYTIDIPDSWSLVDDSKKWDAFFRNGSKNGYAEVTVFDLKSSESVEDVLNVFITRYKMKGSFDNTVFCKYEAIRGEYNLVFNGVDLKMDIVVFKDSYFYYVVMGYANKSSYESMKSELYKIVQSFKIYYDNDVVYSNDEDSDTSTYTDNSTEDSKAKTKTKTNYENNKQETKNKDKTGKQYAIRVKWDKFNKDFYFFEDDFYTAKAEINDITYPSIWKYYNIDTKNDADYNFTFWAKFYQDAFNKNLQRVNDVVDFFTNEAKSKGWDSYTLAYEVIKSIQVIPYERPYNVITDSNQGANMLDYFTPNEVAWYNKGDCDTKSMFIVMVLERLGYDACIYYSREYGHAMAGIAINASGTYKTHNNKKYYFIEATYPGWAIGDLPPEMNNTNKWRLVPID